MIRGLISLTAVTAVLGCGGGVVGEAVRPSAASASEALDEPSSVQACASGFSEPLVIDMKSNERSDLEVAMKDGVAVVAYDCKVLKVLKGCSAHGSYTFAGVTRKEDLVRMSGRDELEANLPLASASLGASMKRGSTLDLALVTIGKQRATASEITEADLSGSCEGATHVVRGTYVGAFALSTGTEGEVRAVAQIFSVGAKASSKVEKSTSAKDGELEACRQATADATSPPTECRSLTRLELLPLVAQKSEDTRPSEEGPKERTCPPGSSWDGLKCAFGKPSVPACKRYGPAAACRAACDAGNGESCFNLTLYPEATPGPDGVVKEPRWDVAKADLALLDKSCTLGFVDGCSIAQVKADMDKQPAKARGYVAKACNLGDGYACFTIAHWYDPNGPEVPDTVKSFDKTYEYIKRACDLGHGLACNALGVMHRDGSGAKRDGALAIAAFERQCAGGRYLDGQGCLAIASMYAKGQGVAVDQSKALGYYERACDLRNAIACNEGALLIRSTDPGRARAMLERGCAKGAAGWDACLQLGEAYETGGLGLQKDFAMAAEVYLRSCAKGACGKAGDLYSKGGPNLAKNPEKARESYKQGCTRSGDEQSCVKLEALLIKSKDKAELLSFYDSRCGMDVKACIKSKKAGGTPNEHSMKYHTTEAQRNCQEKKDGDACKLWKELGGEPTAAELKQPSAAKATDKKP